MTPSELIAACEQAKECGGRITLSFKKGTKRLQGFPRGKLLCEVNGSRTYSFDADKVIECVQKHLKQCGKLDQPPT